MWEMISNGDNLPTIPTVCRSSKIKELIKKKTYLKEKSSQNEKVAIFFVGKYFFAYIWN